MTPTEAALRRSKTVTVMATGSPCSTVALLWTLQHGCATPRVVVLDELDPLSRSYVEALASMFGLERPVPPQAPSGAPEVVVWGSRLGKAVERPKDGAGVTHLRPLIGYSEQEVLSELRALGIRPHPGFELGIGPATLERLRDEAEHVQVDTIDQALAVIAIKRGEIELDDLRIAPSGEQLDDEEPVA